MSKPNHHFEAILFDLDGTLYDSAKLDVLSLSRLLEDDLGWDVGNLDIHDYLGVSSRKVLERVSPDRIDELLPKWLLYQDELREQTNLFPNVKSTLTILKESGFKLGVVTSQNKSELEATRSHIQIENLIQVWVSASDTKYPKPNPAPVAKALALLGVKAEMTIFIGDSLSDLQAGRSAGTKVGAGLWGARHQDELVQFEPNFIFREISDLMTLV